MPKKRRDMDTLMDPRTDGRITGQTGHKRVPLIRKLMQIPAMKIVRIAKPQPAKIRSDSARQNVRGRRQTIERRWGGSGTIHVDPRRRKNFLDDCRGIKILDTDRRATSATTKIERKILRKKRKTDIMPQKRKEDR